MHPPESPAEEDEQRSGAGDVDDRGCEGNSPDPHAVERRVEDDVEGEVPERDRRRDPGRLEAEERAVEHQHRPVEGQPEREGREGGRDDVGLIGGEGPALVEEPDDRDGEDGAHGARRQEQEADLSEPKRDRLPEPHDVVACGEPREPREEDGGNGDGEDPLREHVDAECGVDGARRERRVDVSGREERVDDEVEVDEPDAEGDREHEDEDALERRVAQVEHGPDAPVFPPQPPDGRDRLDDRAGEDASRVDVELRLDALEARHEHDERDDDREVPEHRHQRRDGELLVRVQDPRDDPGDAHEDHDREQEAREGRGELLVGPAEQAHDPGREQEEQAGRSAEDD